MNEEFEEGKNYLSAALSSRSLSACDTPHLWQDIRATSILSIF
jgi:hypothetical protein